MYTMYLNFYPESLTLRFEKGRSPDLRTPGRPSHPYFGQWREAGLGPPRLGGA